MKTKIVTINRVVPAPPKGRRFIVIDDPKSKLASAPKPKKDYKKGWKENLQNDPLGKAILKKFPL